MNIVIVSRSWFTHVQGGAERYLYEVTKNLVKKGHQVHTVSRNGSDLTNRHTTIKLPCIPFVSSVLTSLISGLMVTVGSYEVAIVNGYWAEFCPLVISKPCVLILHDVGLFRSNLAKKNRLKHLLRGVILRSVLKRATKVVVPSRLTMNDIKRYLDVDENKLRFVAEGVDLKRFKPQPREPEEVFRVFQSGRFAPNKGQHLTIEGFKTARKRCRNMILSIVGHLSENQVGYYRHLLTLAKGDDDIVFMTSVSDEELIGYYQEADLCVFPSTAEEGWGITITEAYACRVPVICSPIFFETGVADRTRAMMCRTDPEDIANKMAWAFDHPDEMRALAERGHAFAEGLSWTRTCESVLEVVNEILHGRGRSRVSAS